ncbi:transposase, partial [Sedimentitalea sp. JM2-8]
TSPNCSLNPLRKLLKRNIRGVTFGRRLPQYRGQICMPVHRARLVDHAPFGHWRTQTFIGAPRHDRLDAPWVIDGAMSAEIFALYIKTQLGPTLREGDVVILDNLSSHKAPVAAEALRSIGAWFLFLPPCSPDLNPIKLAFSKLKTLIRKAAARTYDQLWAAVGKVCDLFSDEECYNYFKAAGYEAN